MSPNVSVVITCFNLERYIGAAIESVLAQDYGAPVEIIVVDDCSSDGSGKRIRSYRDVRYLRTERNSGVLLASLAGVAAASNDLIFYLDGDDVWEVGKLSAAVACFDAGPSVAFVTHDLSFIDSDGRWLDQVSRPEQEMKGLSSREQGEKVRAGLLTQGDYVWLGSAFAVRRSITEFDQFEAWARALPDPENTYQDWPLAYWIAALPGTAFGYVPQKLFRYRVHQANHSGDARTAERAVRNFRRAHNTAWAMRDIARRRALSQPIMSIADERVCFYQYLVELNSGRYWQATRGLLQSIHYLRSRGLLRKELIRFFAISVIGPTRFASIASRRSFLRKVPVS